MKLHHFAFALITLSLATSPVHGQQTVIRDAGGRTIGTASTDSGGQTTFRDSGGRTTGTATQSFQGSAGSTTTFRDAGGRTTGTASTPRR